MTWWKRNGNTVLTIAELVGFVGTIVTVARAAPKVARKLERQQKKKVVKEEIVRGVSTDRLVDLTFKEKAVSTARCLFPECITPLIFATGTIVAMTCRSRQYRSATALASGYPMLKRLYDEHKDEVNEVMNDICPLNPDNPTALDNIEESMNGLPEDEKNDIFFLEYSGRRFRSKMSDVEEALGLADELFQEQGFISFNELYLLLGIAETKLGVENGFADTARLNYPDHQESEHIEWSIRGVTAAEGINALDATKLQDNDKVIYMISFGNSLDNIFIYDSLHSLEYDYSLSL